MLRNQKKIKTELEQIKNNKDADSSEKQTELTRKLKKLKKALDKTNNGKNLNKSNNNFQLV